MQRLLRIRDWSQGDLARAARWQVAFVNQLISGRRENPTNKTMLRLANAFGVPRHVLLNDGLSDLALRTELSRGALRNAERAGLQIDRRAFALIGTNAAPVSAEDWESASAITVVVTESLLSPGGDKASSRPMGKVKRHGRQ